jgi:hypothetical protein
MFVRMVHYIHWIETKLQACNGTWYNSETQQRKYSCILYINCGVCLSVTELGSITERARRGGWVQSNDPDSQRVKPARPRLTTHGRARRRTVPFLSYLTQPHDLSNSTTQILEESNVHGRERRRADGREDGRIPFSFTLHTLSIFPIQRPRFPKSLTCTAENNDARTGERTDGSLFLLPYTPFQSFQFNDPDSRRL